MKLLEGVCGCCSAVAVGNSACLGEDSTDRLRECRALGLEVIASTFEGARCGKARLVSVQAEMERAFEKWRVRCVYGLSCDGRQGEVVRRVPLKRARARCESRRFP